MINQEKLHNLVKRAESSTLSESRPLANTNDQAKKTPKSGERGRILYLLGTKILSQPKWSTKENSKIWWKGPNPLSSQNRDP